jgi:hypothetical protein
MMKYLMNCGMKMNFMSEFSEDGDCGGDMVVKILSDGKQSDSCADDDVNGSDMQHGARGQR